MESRSESHSTDPFTVFVFLISASRMVFEESLMHASVRLVEGAARTAGLAGGEDEFLEQLRLEIDDMKWRSIDDHEQYIAFLEDVLRRTAAEAKRRIAEAQ
jgi:hypothetical protein